MSESVLADYLSESDLAEQLGVTLRTLRRWRQQPDFVAHVRLGGRRLYRREAVRAWLARREQGGNPRRGR